MTHYNFTDRLRRGLHIARDEAARLQHAFVGPEHIFLGMLRVEGTGVRALEALGVLVPALREQLLAAMPTGRESQPAMELPYTSKAKRSFEHAMVVARELGHSYVGTEHMILGFLRELQILPGEALRTAGVTEEALTAEVARLHRGTTVAPRASSGVATITIVVDRGSGHPDEATFGDVASAVRYLQALLPPDDE